MDSIEDDVKQNEVQNRVNIAVSRYHEEKLKQCGFDGCTTQKNRCAAHRCSNTYCIDMTSVMECYHIPGVVLNTIDLPFDLVAIICSYDVSYYGDLCRTCSYGAMLLDTQPEWDSDFESSSDSSDGDNESSDSSDGDDEYNEYDAVDVCLDPSMSQLQMFHRD